jgi:tRNA(Ile)-lysidine synthase
MNFKLSAKIPKDVVLSFSSGVDSHFGYDFLKGGNRNIRLLHFNHGTSMSNVYKYHAKIFAMTEGIPIEVINITGDNEFDWSNKRREYVKSLSETVVTCHHKDDNEETILMRAREIPSVNENIIRPFLNITKSQIYSYAESKGLIWIEDPTNQIGFTKRNRIRKELIPLARDIGVRLNSK